MNFIKSVLKLTGVMLLIVFSIVGGAYAWLRINGKIGGSTNNGNGDKGGIISNLFDNSAKKETKNVLIAVLHTEASPLTDFIMLVQYNPETKRAAALSIPRDTKVIGSIDGKINSTYAKRRDMQDLVDKVTELTSVKIDNYVLLDTKAIEKMVDAVGGITYDVPFNMKYDDNSQNLHINIMKGKQTLNGANVVKLLRFRKNNDGTIAWGDIQRINLQQDFIKAAAPQLLTPKVILKIPELVGIAFELVRTDATIDEILSYVDEAKTFNTENISMDMLPGDAQYIDGVSYYVADPKKTIEIVNELFFNTTPGVEKADETISNSVVTAQVINEPEPEPEPEPVVTITKEDLSIEVLNATSRNGLAAKVSEKLKGDGYNVNKIGNYKTSSDKKTTIIDRCEDKTFAEDLKKFLGKGTIKTEEKTENTADITVILGSDY